MIVNKSRFIGQTRWAMPGAIGLLVAMACAGCEREARNPRVQPPDAQVLNTLTLTELQAGGAMEAADGAVENQYEHNAFAMARGKRLYSDFNCVGCHANGGGGMGPPLMDDEWIYGYRPEQVYASILQGRPDGMPAFQGRLTNEQAWQLAAYVRSLGGLADPLAAPGRADQMKSRPPEHSLPRQQPRQ